MSIQFSPTLFPTYFGSISTFSPTDIGTNEPTSINCALPGVCANRLQKQIYSVSQRTSRVWCRCSYWFMFRITDFLEQTMVCIGSHVLLARWGSVKWRRQPYYSRQECRSGSVYEWVELLSLEFTSKRREWDLRSADLWWVWECRVSEFAWVSVGCKAFVLDSRFSFNT